MATSPDSQRTAELLAAGKPRVLAIGLDGADAVWLERWMAEGALPTIADIVARGSYARLDSIAGFSDSVWPSFYTGTGPATHGYYHHRQVQPGTLRLIPTLSRAYKRPFWWLLREQQVRMVVFDVPKAPLQEQSGACQVLGWGEHYAYQRSSQPPNLLPEIERRFGRHPHLREVFPTRDVRHEQRLLGDIVLGAGRRAEVAGHLMAQCPWDLFLMVFSEAHSGGHQFLHHLDPSSPFFDSQRASQMHGAMREAYVAVDRAIGHILASASPDSNVLVFSLHGLETDYVTGSLLGPLLERLGYQCPPQAAQRSRRDPIVWLRGLLPQSVRDGINALLPRSTQDELIARFFERGCDWSQTRAVAEDSREGYPWIRINLRGREPGGIVEPAGEYDALCAELTEELRKVRIHPGGQPAVRGVWRTDEVFHGPRVRDLPDLIVFWQDGTAISALEHPKTGVITSAVPTIQRAKHTAQGFLAAAGRRLRPAAKLSAAHILDLAPTLLYLLGGVVPTDMEGQVLTDLIADGFLSANPVRRADVDWDVEPWDGL